MTEPMRELQVTECAPDNSRTDLSLQRDFANVVLDALPGLVFVKDADGRFTMANAAAAARFGTSIEGLLGKLEADVNPRTEDVARLHQAEQQVIRTGVAREAVEEPLVDPITGA